MILVKGYLIDKILPKEYITKKVEDHWCAGNICLDRIPDPLCGSSRKLLTLVSKLPIFNLNTQLEINLNVAIQSNPLKKEIDKPSRVA